MSFHFKKWPFYLGLFVLVCGFGQAARADAPTVEEKVLQSGGIDFSPKYGQRLRPPNAGDHLTCEADVRYPEIPDTFHKNHFLYRDYVNRRFKMLAQANLCTEDLSSASLRPKVTFFRGSIISVMFHQILYPAGGNGSCHGHQEYMTFNLDTGKEFALADLLYAKDFPEIKSSIVDYFKTRGVTSKEVETILDEKFWALGFYIEDGKIFVDMNTFLRSCAEGNHYPVEIDAKFLHENYENRPLLDALKSKP